MISLSVDKQDLRVTILVPQKDVMCLSVCVGVLSVQFRFIVRVASFNGNGCKKRSCEMWDKITGNNLARFC